MTQCLLLLCLINLSNDSLEIDQHVLPKTHSKQIVVNAFLSTGLGITAGIFHVRGNDAYTDYRNSTTVAEAVENWEKTKLNDNVRNICAAGAVFFAVRTIYYHVKNRKNKKPDGPKSSTRLDFRYIDTSKWVLCIQKVL
ncbi:MAG: hypothetical protein WBB37_06915 [bacterium]